MSTYYADLLNAAVERLDDDQRAAAIEICNGAGNLRVCARAGSGKTSLLVTSIAAGLRAGKFKPEELILITFTAKAGKELRDRLAPLLPFGTLDSMRVGTFHALALRALRAHDGEDSWPMGRCLDTDKRDPGIPSTGQLWSEVLGWKGISGLPEGKKGLDIDLAAAGLTQRDYSTAIDVWRSSEHVTKFNLDKTKIPKIWEAWDLYQQAKQAVSAWDFADTLTAWHGHLLGNVNATTSIRLVLVDEAQDNSWLQLDIARRLAASSRLVLVGDEAQAIFEWRGAFPSLFIHAEETLGAKTVCLPNNYRSGSKIVDIGNRVIEGASWCVGKPALAARPTSGAVGVLPGAGDPLIEAEDVAGRIAGVLLDGVPPEEFAILVRTNAYSGIFEAALIKRQIPAVIVGSLPFFQRKETLDFLAYCILAVGDSMPALGRIINRPKRLLGQAFVEKVGEHVAQGHPLPEAVGVIGQTLPGSKQRDAAYTLAQLLADLRAPPWVDAAKRIATLLTPKTHAVSDGDEDRAAMYAAASSVARSFDTAKDFAIFAVENEKKIAMLADGQVTGETLKGKVTISSIHKSKGLEWTYVFVPCSAGVFPHQRSTKSPARMEEERRLFYVASTRAKDALIFSWSDTNLYGATAGVSPFLVDFVDSSLGASTDPEGTLVDGEDPDGASDTSENATTPKPTGAPCMTPKPITEKMWSDYLLLLIDRTAPPPDLENGPNCTATSIGDLLLVGPYPPWPKVGQDTGHFWDLPMPRPWTFLRVRFTPNFHVTAFSIGTGTIGPRQIREKVKGITIIGGWKSNLVDAIMDMAQEILLRPTCSDCARPMMKRPGHKGPFWGCPNWPNCKGTKPYEGI